MPLCSWAYVSDSCLDPAAAEVEVRDVVQNASLRNHSLYVTGALLYTGSHFAQLLEGPRGAVEQLRASILRDDRHCNVQTVLEETIEGRRFEGWSLAYAGPSRLVGHVVEQTISEAERRKPSSVDALIRLMRSFHHAQ
jgi:hypothetical protein